jgi:hypothetical protein
VEEAAHAQAEPLAESVNASGALNLPYLVEVRFPVLTQWLSAEVSLCQPENPMTFIHGLLKDKLALRKSARFEATEVDQYLEECLERPHLVTGGLEMSIPCVRSSFRLALVEFYRHHEPKANPLACVESITRSAKHGATKETVLLALENMYGSDAVHRLLADMEDMGITGDGGYREVSQAKRATNAAAAKWKGFTAKRAGNAECSCSGCRTFKSMRATAYLRRVDFSSIIEFMTAETMMHQPEDPIKFLLHLIAENAHAPHVASRSEHEVSQLLPVGLVAVTYKRVVDGMIYTPGTAIEVREVLRASPDTFLPGARVQARYGGQAGWYAGRILCTNDNGSSNVAYDDGDVEDGVRRYRIRTRADVIPSVLIVDEEVDVRYSSGEQKNKLYPARISAVYGDGTYGVEYADGDSEDPVPLGDIYARYRVTATVEGAEAKSTWRAAQIVRTQHEQSRSSVIVVYDDPEEEVEEVEVEVGDIRLPSGAHSAFEGCLNLSGCAVQTGCNGLFLLHSEKHDGRPVYKSKRGEEVDDANDGRTKNTFEGVYLYYVEKDGTWNVSNHLGGLNVCVYAKQDIFHVTELTAPWMELQPTRRRAGAEWKKNGHIRWEPHIVRAKLDDD